jgi:anti-sigma factor RsiW
MTGCKDHFDKISACLDGDLAECEMDEVLKHLQECPCCQECHDTIKAVKEMLGKMPQPEMPPDLKARLKSCLEKGR